MGGFFGSVGKLERDRRRGEHARARNERIAAANEAADFRNVQRAGREFLRKAARLGMAVPSYGHWCLGNGMVLDPSVDPPVLYDGRPLDVEAVWSIKARDSYCHGSRYVSDQAIAAMRNLLERR